MSFKYRVEDNIVIFSFRNGKFKSINFDTLQGLDQVISRLNSEEELKGLVITGEDKYFSSGFDLETFTSFKTHDEIVKWFTYEEEVMYKLFTCSKPVIAAINGHATAAGMIVSMACDYRIAINNPKTKIGMTEIKIGLSLTPAEGEIMRFGLDTDKNFRDIIFTGELITTMQAVEKGIFDELVDTQEELIEKARAKIASLMDTPGSPFIMLKNLEKKHAADYILAGIKDCDWNYLVTKFTDKKVIAILNMVKASMA
jgi:enoyl-CoA hydratase/carnithine racemase